MVNICIILPLDSLLPAGGQKEGAVNDLDS